MIIEQLIFSIIAFALFVIMFFKMIKDNDSTYVTILVLQAIGIAISFIGVIYGVNVNIVLKILMYTMSVLLPIFIILMEKNNISFFEKINILKAQIYLKMGNNKKAKQILINIASKNEFSYKAHKLLAEIYELEGGMRKAIDEYVLAIEINKKDYNSYYKVAVLLNNLDKKEEASQMLNNLLKIKPDYLEAIDLLGDIYISKDMYKEAVNVYQEALKYTQTDYNIYYNLGIAYTMLNDFQNAKICYEKAAQLNSLLYNTKYSLAEIALIYKDLEEAEKRFLETIEDEELSADAYFELSKISIIKKDKDTAIKYANIAIDIDSKKIVDKIKKDPIFIPIFARLSIPFNLNSPEQEESKLSNKYIKSKEHLEDMVEITRKLSYNDINLLKRNDQPNIKVQENSTIEDIQKEIQD